MPTTLSELARLVEGELHGDAETLLSGVSSIPSAAPETIVFAESKTPEALDAAVRSPAGAVIAGTGCGDHLGEKPGILVANPRLAFARVAAFLHPPARPAPGIHPTAVVDESVRLGEDVYVGPQASVEAGVVLGDRVSIGAGCAVGRDVRLGADTLLHPRVTIYAGAILGSRVIVKAGAVLGSDGFGYVETAEGRVKFPQLGTLLIEDDVEIGANTTIDRGALDATVIGEGTKIDNQVQIAHNVRIGRHSVLVSQVGVSGSAVIGDHVVLAGQAGLGDGCILEDRLVVGGGAAVLPGKRLRSGEVYWGAPARPLKDEKTRLVNILRIPRMLASISTLKGRVSALEELVGEDE